MIELTDAENEDGNISTERMEKLSEEIRRLDEGEIVVEDLNSTRDILNSVVTNGVDYMEEEEKTTVVKKLMELVQRKDVKIGDMVGVIKDLHKRCYRFINMRDGLHRLRTRNLELQTQQTNTERRLNEVLEAEEKNRLETEKAKRDKESMEGRLEEVRERREEVEKSLKRANDRVKKKTNEERETKEELSKL